MIEGYWKDAEVIIFCQAPADLIYVLNIIERFKIQKKILITRNTKSLYFFLQKLNLENTWIVHLENLTLDLRSLKSIRLNKKIISETIYLFSNFKEKKVYFFSTSYDYYTAALVAKLSEKNHVYYYNHYDCLTSKVGNKSFSLVRIIKAKLYQYITNGVKFLHDQHKNFPKFNASLYPIESLTIYKKPVVNKKYLYTVNTHPNVLLLISEKEIMSLALNEVDKIYIIVNHFKNNFKIYYKGHPRLGSSVIVSNWADEIIPDIIPSEFICYKKFEYVIGIGSAALCYPAEKKYSKVISLLKHVKSLNNYSNEDLIIYLKEYSRNSIDFEFFESI
jgi:hypothetical protein